MNIKRVFISLVLTIALISATTLDSFADVDGFVCISDIPELPAEAVIKNVVDENGVTYTIKSYYEDGIRTVQMSSDNSSNIMVFENSNEEDLTIQKYSLIDEGNSEKDDDNIYSVQEKTYEIDALSENFTVQEEATASLTYGHNFLETYRHKYYYSMGSSSYGNLYMKIGCVAEYNIKYWTLSESQQSKCDSYASEIRQVINHMSSANDISSVNWMLAGASVLFAAGAVSMPVAIALLGAVAGGTYAARVELAGAQEDYYDAAYYYSIIKYYPHL